MTSARGEVTGTWRPARSLSRDAARPERRERASLNAAGGGGARCFTENRRIASPSTRYFRGHRAAGGAVNQEAMKLFSTLAALAAVVTAQDGGVRVQPAYPAPEAAAPMDAGTAVVKEAAAPAAVRDAGAAPARQAAAPTPAVDAGTAAPKVIMVPAPDNTAELQRLKTELESQSQKLEQAVDELEALRAEQRARHEQEQAQEAQQAAQREAAVTIGTVEQLLLTGDTNVVDTLTDLEGSLGPAASAHIEAARQALANSDLTAARYYLALAAQAAQQGH